MAQQKITLDIPESLTPAARVTLADLVIEHIIDRTKRGLDRDGAKFPKYSKAYINSLEFKNAGKSTKVDLTLSGDMLAALTLLNHKRGAITIGYERGSEENGRAEGNIEGTYGGSSPIKGKQRDFLGLTDKKLSDLIDFVRVEQDGAG